jgi:pimeloyl-ACP methyl ester carboxylesterase
MEADYRATLAAWQQLHCGNRAALVDYRERLSRLLMLANRSGCLDPRGQLTVKTGQGVLIVPIAYYGFAWTRGDFSQVLLASDFHGELEHHYYTAGLGVSLVAVRQSCGDDTYFGTRQSFPVTAVLRSTDSGAVLQFYNPLEIDSVPAGQLACRLDRDLSASLIYQKKETPRRFVEGFLDPGEIGVKPKLLLMEPYQRGKIPVVFIHGLGSEPLTWADAVNHLRAQRDIYERFQFWFFRYPTGGDLLQSAAALREKLLTARDTFDPQQCDPALEQMVLVGHSLGGLVAQLQVSYSYDILWQHAARQPMEAVRAPTQMLAQLRSSFYFDPSPLVKRVVFVATPHHGSGMARRLVGRAASKLVHYSPGEEDDYRRLMDCNRDVFREFLWEKKPTALDLLEPDNPFLNALAQMPISHCVRYHSIIGDPIITLDGQGSDGVVPVSSARLPGSCSERFVCARHSRVNKADECVDELARILREHAMASHFASGESRTIVTNEAPIKGSLP